MNFWKLLYCMITGTDPSEMEQQQNRQRIRASTLTNPISPDPNIFTYRTQDGTQYFQFSYHKIRNKKYEIDIHLFPNFNGRSQDVHTIHTLRSPRLAKYKICIHSGREPKNIEDAKEVSKMYAELINTYIKTGKTPDQQISKQ